MKLKAFVTDLLDDLLPGPQLNLHCAQCGRVVHRFRAQRGMSFRDGLDPLTCPEHGLLVDLDLAELVAHARVRRNVYLPPV